ncbi:hypothetical protein [Gemella sp. zg-1178]|uniref:hypothetical protein n=1 Tax=Gemella sp. zg-1178 TaxID=2840372 RepID=UPI001C0484CD|nr:hypothetical protein [Gemella sp. zg-1178]MBU0278149.1 hypothetical protein [Gemella sp. zg-1178]
MFTDKYQILVYTNILIYFINKYFIESEFLGIIIAISSITTAIVMFRSIFKEHKKEKTIREEIE